MTLPQHIPGQTFHGRRGAIQNAFRYGVDYVLFDPEAPQRGPGLFAHNRRNLTSVWDGDHGGPPGQGRGVAWVREQLTAVIPDPGLAVRILLMAQPRVLGHVFNPVSFWLCFDADDALRVVIAEVTNTYGDRHSYLCHRDDFAPMTRADQVSARKVFHVSPFQPVAGGYKFRFDIQSDRIGIWIELTRDENAAQGGLVATLTGPRVPLTNRGILWACLRRPFGSRRVLGLIHWQAVKLWWKGAVWHVRPTPPSDEITR